MAWKKPHGRDPRYSTNEWRQMQREQLHRFPNCQMCTIRNRFYPDHPIAKAKVVDHIKPIFLFPNLFFDPNNLQSICEECNAFKIGYDKRKPFSEVCFYGPKGYISYITGLPIQPPIRETKSSRGSYFKAPKEY